MDAAMREFKFNSNTLHLQKLVLKGCVTWDGLILLLKEIKSDITQLDVDFNDKVLNGTSLRKPR